MLLPPSTSNVASGLVLPIHTTIAQGPAIFMLPGYRGRTPSAVPREHNQGSWPRDVCDPQLLSIARAVSFLSCLTIYSNMSSKLLGAVGGAALLGLGGYAFVQQQEVSKLEKEVDNVTRMVNKEKQTVATNKKLIAEEEQKIKVIESKVQAGRASLAETEAALEQARQEVARLEEEFGKKESEIAKLTSDAKVRRLTAGRRHRERRRARGRAHVHEGCSLLAARSFSRHCCRAALTKHMQCTWLHTRYMLPCALS